MLGLPKLSVDPVLFLPLWLGSIRDASGTGNHGTPAGGLHWRAKNGKDHLHFGASAILSVTDAANLRSTTWTWFVAGRDWDHYVLSDRIISKRDAGGTQIDIRKNNAVQLGIYDGVTTPFRIWAPTPATRSICITMANGVTANLYVDGALDGAFSEASTITEDDADLLVGSYWSGGFQSTSPFDCVIGYPGTLGASEIALLHAWCAATVTPRHQWPGGGITTGDPKYIDNIQTARVSLANETSGQLSNTGLSIITGTWKITESAAGRAITCVSAGKLRRHLVGASGFTTQLFSETGGATLTKNAANFEVDAGNGDTVTAIQLVA